MTPVDAIAIAALDAEEAKAPLASASDPETLLQLWGRWALHRLRGLDDGHGITIAKRVLRYGVASPSPAERVAVHTENILAALLSEVRANRWDMDALAAWALWIAGAILQDGQRHPGFCQPFLAALPDRHSTQVQERMERAVDTVLRSLREMDIAERAARADLGPVWIARLDSLDHQGALAFLDDDGETARLLRTHARRVQAFAKARVAGGWTGHGISDGGGRASQPSHAGSPGPVSTPTRPTTTPPPRTRPGAPEKPRGWTR